MIIGLLLRNARRGRVRTKVRVQGSPDRCCSCDRGVFRGVCRHRRQKTRIQASLKFTWPLLPSLVCVAGDSDSPVSRLGRLQHPCLSRRNGNSHSNRATSREFSCIINASCTLCKRAVPAKPSLQRSRKATPTRAVSPVARNAVQGPRDENTRNVENSAPLTVGFRTSSRRKRGGNEARRRALGRAHDAAPRRPTARTSATRPTPRRPRPRPRPRTTTRTPVPV